MGDINGVGLEIALRAHHKISKKVQPLYCINKDLLFRGADMLQLSVPKDFFIVEVGKDFEIEPSSVTQKSGQFSFDSFCKAIELCENKQTQAIVTLPIHKEAWAKAGIAFRGHTEYLDSHFSKNAIMLMGWKNLFVALFTHHIPLKEVPSQIEKQKLYDFFTTLGSALKVDKIGVLGLNPHAGDNGVIGDEEKEIQEAIQKANLHFAKELFVGPLVPDTAFVQNKLRYFVAMYHDQGLIALKSRYFYESINASLNLPIVRTSVDHGTAYDIAYKDKNPSIISYINAVKFAIKQVC